MQIHHSATPLYVPSLAQIAVTAAGNVQVQGGRPYRSGPVPGLGDLLSQLLERGGAPPPVLEIQRQTQAEPPIFDSLVALHAALEYFARPDAHGLLSDYYNRASIAIEVASKNVAFEALKEKTKSHNDWEDEKREDKPKKKSRRVYWVAAVMLISLAAGLIAWRYGRQRAPMLAGPATAAVEAISATGKQVAEAATTAIASLIGGSTTLPSNASPAAPAPVSPPPATTPPRRAASAPKVDQLPTGPPPPAAVQPPPPVVAPAVEPPAPGPVPAFEDVIYAAKDTDVRAPELVYPQLPTRPVGVSPLDRPGEFVILVLEDGTVGEVRLVPAADRLQDRMMVSAVKAWKFRPAERNGQPVRYRIRIPIPW